MRLGGTETSIYTCVIKNEAEEPGGPDDNVLFLTDVLMYHSPALAAQLSKLGL